MIFTTLSPNTQFDDFINAFITILKPHKYKDGRYVRQVGRFFERYFHSKVFLFESGRSALYEILRSMDLKKGDEIFVSAFTCVAAVNPSKWNFLKISYADISKDTFNVSFQDLKKKITPKTKAILVQHTFGYPAKIKKIIRFARKNNIFVIEDCAHTIGSSYRGKKLGTFGDASIFSLGRDKAVSGSFGGVALLNNKNIQNKMNKLKKKSTLSKIWIARQVLYTLSCYPIRKTYSLYLGKLIHLLSKKTNLTKNATSEGEKLLGTKPSHIGNLLPNAFARVAYRQLKKLDHFNKHRNKLWRFYKKFLQDNNKIILPKWKYSKNIFPLRYPILVKNNGRDDLIDNMKKNKIILGTWYDQVIAPRNVNLKNLGYKNGECPKAEDVANSVVNLPLGVNVTLEKAKKIVKVLNKF